MSETDEQKRLRNEIRTIMQSQLSPDDKNIAIQKLITPAKVSKPPTIVSVKETRFWDYIMVILKINNMVASIT